MAWSRVSNAADMSRAVRIVIFQSQYIVSMMSFVSMTRAVSVELEFAIGRLQRAETGRYGYMRKKTSQGETFEHFANSVQIRKGSKIFKARILVGQGFFQKR